MSELPKDSARTIVTSELSPAVEELLERYARRARRVIVPVAETDLPVDVEYVTVSPQSRLATLRRLLDEVEASAGVVFVRDGGAKPDVDRLLSALGYSGPSAEIRADSVARSGADLVVLFDVPASRDELRQLTAGATRTIALIQPRQLAGLRGLTAHGAVKPITLVESGLRARDRDARLRAELRGLLTEAQFGRELLALEPLLDEFDGVEVAAAAVQLLERERVAHAASADAKSTAAAGSSPRGRSTAGMVSLFVTVGSRDGVQPGDLVGAIANTAGITSAEVGKIDVRESHSLVEVAADVVDSVIERVTGTSIKGRRAVVRRDEERGKREAGGGKR